MQGWGVTTAAGIASYPLDTIRRRMMMTSGEKVHYKSMMDAGRQIVAAEGVRSLFHGAGANILRSVCNPASFYTNTDLSHWAVVLLALVCSPSTTRSRSSSRLNQLRPPISLYSRRPALGLHGRFSLRLDFLPQAFRCARCCLVLSVSIECNQS